jgi:hypothetical protein
MSAINNTKLPSGRRTKLYLIKGQFSGDRAVSTRLFPAPPNTTSCRAAEMPTDDDDDDSTLDDMDNTVLELPMVYVSAMTESSTAMSSSPRN